MTKGMDMVASGEWSVLSVGFNGSAWQGCQHRGEGSDYECIHHLIFFWIFVPDLKPNFGPPLWDLTDCEPQKGNGTSMPEPEILNFITQIKNQQLEFENSGAASSTSNHMWGAHTKWVGIPNAQTKQTIKGIEKARVSERKQAIKINMWEVQHRSGQADTFSAAYQTLANDACQLSQSQECLSCWVSHIQGCPWLYSQIDLELWELT